MFLLRNEVANRSVEVLFIQFLVYFAIVLILSLLNTAILRFAALVVVKPMPRFKTAFFISLLSWILLFVGSFIVSGLTEPRGGSVLNGGSLEAAVDLPLIKILPVVLFFLSSWILNSQNLTDSELKTIGYGKGLVVTLVQSTAMAAVLLVPMLFFLYRQ